MKTLHKQKIETKKLETSTKKLSNINFWTLIFSLLVLAYIVAIWYPYSSGAGPRSEATLERVSTWDHVICGLMILLTLLYVRFIIKHFKEINKFRFILYPLIYITCFILLQIRLFTINPILLWYLIISIPAGIIGFIAIIIVAIIKDIKDRENEKNIIKNNTKSKK